jgi:hypothetical protein
MEEPDYNAITNKVLEVLRDNLMVNGEIPKAQLFYCLEVMRQKIIRIAFCSTDTEDKLRRGL